MRYRVKRYILAEVPNRFTVLEDLDTEVDINSARDVGCSRLLHQRKQVKLQWL
jgi:hypothetical protein